MIEIKAEERQAAGQEKGQDLRSIVLRLNGALRDVPEAIAFASPPPPIQGIGNVSGFTMQVEIKNGDFDYPLLPSRRTSNSANSTAR